MGELELEANMHQTRKWRDLIDSDSDSDSDDEDDDDEDDEKLASKHSKKAKKETKPYIFKSWRDALDFNSDSDDEKESQNTNDDDDDSNNDDEESEFDIRDYAICHSDDEDEETVIQPERMMGAPFLGVQKPKEKYMDTLRTNKMETSKPSFDAENNQWNECELGMFDIGTATLISP